MLDAIPRQGIPAARERMPPRHYLVQDDAQRPCVVGFLDGEASQLQIPEENEQRF